MVCWLVRVLGGVRDFGVLIDTYLVVPTLRDKVVCVLFSI